MKLSALAFALLFLAQQPQPQTTVRGRMEGTVLRENTAEPIIGAKITVTRVNAAGNAVPTAGAINTFLINPSPNVPGAPGPGPNQAPPPNLPPVQPIPVPPVYSDRAGRFAVPDLDEGTYRIAVTLNGYVRQEYGQRTFAGQGTPLTLKKGETMKDLTVRLTRAGNVSGRITDENGQPAAGVPVQLLKVTYNPQGIKLFSQAGLGKTNDRGEYRLYWITPGRYYLAAGTPAGLPPGVGPGGTPSPNESNDPYAFTFYPGTPEQGRATIVEIKAGSDLPMDFVTPRTQLFKISGKVTGANNGPAPINAAWGNQAVGISLGFLRPEGGSGFVVMSQTFDVATGTFEMRNIVPGSYAVQANSGRGTARAAVEVTNADVTNVVLALDGGIEIAGKVEVASGGALPMGPVQIRMKPVFKNVSHFVGAVPQAGSAPADGTFKLNGILPGTYRASANANNYYIKEIRYDGGDALNRDIDVTAGGSTAPTMTVVISAGVAQVDGTVTDDRGQALPGVQAVLVPERNRDRTDLYKAAATDQSGKFSMTGVAPGDYKLFAWDSIDNFAYFEQDFIQKYEARGKVMHIEEGAKLNGDTKLIQ